MKILSFYINGCIYGADISCIKELNRSVSVIDVPTAPGFICGLYNMRGQIVTVINTENFLLQEKCKDNVEYCVVLKPYKGSPDIFGFFIDKAADVYNIDAKDILPPPSSIHAEVREYVFGVVECEGALITLIAIDKILDKII